MGIKTTMSSLMQAQLSNLSPHRISLLEEQLQAERMRHTKSRLNSHSSRRSFRGHKKKKMRTQKHTNRLMIDSNAFPIIDQRGSGRGSQKESAAETEQYSQQSHIRGQYITQDQGASQLNLDDDFESFNQKAQTQQITRVTKNGHLPVQNRESDRKHRNSGVNQSKDIQENSHDLQGSKPIKTTNQMQDSNGNIIHSIE